MTRTINVLMYSLRTMDNECSNKCKKTIKRERGFEMESRPVRWINFDPIMSCQLSVGRKFSNTFNICFYIM